MLSNLNMLLQNCKRLFLKYKKTLTAASVFLFIVSIIQFILSAQSLNDLIALCTIIPMVLVVLLLIVYILPCTKPVQFGKNTTGIDIAHFSKNHIEPNTDIPGDIRYTPMNFDPDIRNRFVFANNDQLAQLSGEINYLIFRHTQWAGTGWKGKKREIGALKKKIERNVSHAKHYQRSLILLKDRDTNLVGFTHVFPVSSITWTRYLNKEIPDINFPYDCIANRAKDAYGIIIFSIGSISNISYKKIPETLKINLSDETNETLQKIHLLKKDKKYNILHLRNIYRAVLYHVNEIILNDFLDSTEVPVLIQVEDKGLRKILERNNFKKQEPLSADGCEIFIACLKLTPDDRFNKSA